MTDASGELAGQVAVITGGSSGLGRSVAKRFAREGARILIGDIKPDEGEKVIAEIRSEGGEASFVATDVRQSEDVRHLVAVAETKWQRVDILYSSAGVLPTGTAWETSEKDYANAMDVNVGGCFRLAKFGIPALARTGKGSVIFTGSDLGVVGARGTAAYCASKGAVINLTRAVAIDAAEFGVRVNCLCPGPIDTPMLRGWYDGGDPVEMEKAQVSPVLLKRVGQPEEIANAALFLASDQASFLTGSVLMVDGGVTAWYGM